MSKDHTVQTIVTALNETDERPRSQIAAIVQAIGEQAALAVLVEANAIERNGGMMLPDQSRRRTPGGVFFALARKRLSPEDREAIFPKTPPAKKDDEKEGEPRAGRPDRRHVRLIRPAEPPRAQPEPAAQLELEGVRNNGARVQQPTHPQHSSNGTESKPEVKLVRLDRRRIVSLPPLKPEPVAVKPNKVEAREARAATRAASVSDHEGPSREVPVQKHPAPRGLDLAYRRLDAKKLVVTALADLPVESRRSLLLDLLAEQTDDRSLFSVVSEQAPELRGRILATVGNRLGIPLGQLATTIFGADTPANRRRVKSIAGEPEE
jgi:hypothetical protein